MDVVINPKKSLLTAAFVDVQREIRRAFEVIEKVSGKIMNQRATSFVLCLLRGYKWALSPLMLPACRYVPTCSDYAMEAVDRYGVIRGSLMAMWRVLRCHPFVRGRLRSGGEGPCHESEVVKFERLRRHIEFRAARQLCGH